MTDPDRDKALAELHGSAECFWCTQGMPCTRRDWVGRVLDAGIALGKPQGRREGLEREDLKREIRNLKAQKRSRSEASLPGPASRHQRGSNPATGLPRKRGRNVPHPRQAGTTGSWPAAGADPKPPAICALYEDEAIGDLFADEERLRRGEQPAAVFGQYPRALIPKLLPWLGCQRSEILHVCSGALPPGEGIRVDVRPEARPDILADGRALPLKDGSVAAVMIDPPYTPQYAQGLYGVEYPRPSHLLAEAARVVRPCGRIAFVHYLVPMPPPRCKLVRVFGLSTGFGLHIRAVTVFEREQESLL